MSISTVSSLVSPLNAFCSVRIDPTWEYYQLWRQIYDMGANLPFTGGRIEIPDRVELPFIDTESPIAESSTPNYTLTEIVGRSEAYVTWISTANRTLTLTVELHAQGLQDSPIDAYGIIMKEVVVPAQWLESLKYPLNDPVTDNVIAPPPVIVQIGELYTGRCIAHDVQLNWHHPYDPDSKLPHRAQVQLTFMEVNQMIGGFRFGGGNRFQSVPGSKTDYARNDRVLNRVVNNGDLA